MNILYVGSMSIPLEDILTGKTDNEISGFPGYYYPLRMLIDAGHRVDFVMLSSLNKYNIKVDWFKEDQILYNITSNNSKNSVYRKLQMAGRMIRYTLAVERAIHKKHYDFIYCQEYIGFPGCVSAFLHHIPCGVRFYGDSIALKTQIIPKYEFIKKYGKIKLLFKKPLAYLLYKIKKQFILTTADGTHGDLTYKILKPRKDKCEFFFWTTGVNKQLPIDEPDALSDITGKQFIVFPARIDSIKRQDRAIEVLHILHDKGYHIHLYLIGQICDSKYYSTLKKQINQHGLESYIHFTGGVSQNRLKLYAYHSICSILTSDYSNRGNVFFELFSIGVPIISFNDHSLEEFIVNNQNGFLVENENEMAERVALVCDNQDIRDSIKSNAIITASSKVLSLEERYSMEVSLIEKCASHQTLSGFKHFI